MLAKMTSKNQLTLPRSVTDEVGPAEYFDVEVRQGQIVLTPVRIQRADAVRAKLSALGLTGEDVRDAIAWARQPAKEPALATAENVAVYQVQSGDLARPNQPTRTRSKRKA